MPTFEHDKLFIDGRWTTPSEIGVIDVVDPATENVIGHVPNGSAADVDAAVTAARRAFDPLISVAERRERLDRVIAAMEKRLPEIAELITAEMGAPVRISQSVQTQVPLAVAKGFAEVLDTFEFEERIGNSLVLREPYGVVGAITPWNYPLYQVVAKVVPAIAAGCTVVLKPSNEAPLSVFAFVEACEDAGLPPGTINLVSGPGRVIGEHIAAHPDVDFVSFTGSTGVGARVGELAGQTIKKVALELGGKSANVILEDADLATAVKVGVGNAFLNGGQTCMAWTRMLVPQSRYDEALDLVESAVSRYTVGDPRDPATRIGPSASRSQFDTVRGFIERAQRDGARLLVGGAEPIRDVGFFLAPTVFADVDPDSELGQEEVFGPVLAITPYTDADDALRIANGTPYGLSGAVWAGSDDEAIDFARRVHTGQLDINGGAYNPSAPFGGYKKSGIGRELGRFGFEEYLQTKSLQLKERA
ncbi:aldehyde dehydrogenase family protein [Mycolicibacterium fortuitum]|uniref:aldehyde dehydrogenase (NAD(+)) n=2 Tax=Mycolicibacterium fortuitum TaxID=1766 RepID=A0AAE4VFI0_MYCFO|nr:aldehyde dehydrogenase family protein [Mycolicibacterium fortuitum]MCA4754440.1 aldehyde dehydrogenase family protein [Mycolicibacterium fortuitum]MCV7142637.1 aldehyde dehydrogenase family protein [Mycolicibacterium fortuitum]MDV7193506.1 aldehyde dehydrogenase family protein [Mycolicibacterium fortuitum]MDV7207003.1 aldehyde dehydrogenase family protein [Mycolicibacterium fortuitum]MDV7228425.1 aldehyde dehydrogenase family protein [Mycolicibacterium fortuitum]